MSRATGFLAVFEAMNYFGEVYFKSPHIARYDVFWLFNMGGGCIILKLENFLSLAMLDVKKIYEIKVPH